MSFLFQIIILIALYFAGGQLAWFLAIPPYYACVFWPSAGVAIAFVYRYGYRVLPGVFLGSVLIEIFSPIHHEVGFQWYMTLLGLAFGAALQAFVGAYLLRRFLHDDISFQKLRSVLVFGLIGIVTCFISSSIALLTFYVAGILGADELLRFWFFWYVGDVLGVGVVTPFLILLFQSQGVSTRRKMSVCIPVFMLFCVVFVLFINIKNKDFEIRQADFYKQVELTQQQIEKSFELYLSKMSALKSFYAASNVVDMGEFSVFVKGALDEGSGIYAFGWAPYILQEKLSTFLMEAKTSYNDEFDIKGVAKSGGLETSASQAHYMPVYYLEPDVLRKVALGFDLLSHPSRRKAVVLAKESGVVTASEAIQFLDHANTDDLGFILLEPIYKGSGDSQVFQGVVLGAFQYKDVIERGAALWHDRGIELHLRVPYDGGMRAVYKSDASIDDALLIDGFSVSEPFDYAQQTWFFDYFINPDFYNHAINFSIWYALIAGLLCVSVTTMFLLALTGQTAVMEAVVADKTRQLSSRNKFLNLVMDSVPDMIFVKDENFNIVQANQSFFDKYDPDMRSSLLGTTGLEQFPLKDQEEYLFNDKKAFDAGVSEVEELLTDYKGVTQTLLTRKIRFYDEVGHAFLLGFARDITELKNAREQGQQIAQIFNSSITEFYIFDAKTFQFLFVNEGAVQNMGYSEEEFYALSLSDVNVAYALDNAKKIVLPLLDGSQSQLEFDAKHKRKNGTVYDVVVHLQLTIFQGKEAFIAIVLDVTERNKVLHELQRSNKELQDFAHVTSHDLKAPLRHVSMSAGFFKNRFADQLDEESKALLDDMLSGTERMQNMIESLLAYSRVGRGEHKFTEVNLNDCLLMARENLSAEIVANSAVIESDVLPFVHGDSFLVTQLFQNLIQNAIKYAKEGVEPEIKITAEVRLADVQISVADNGIGVEQIYAQKIFQIFQRLHRDNEYEGVGIGLSICQRIVEFHGGRIYLDAQYIGGAKIAFTLPISID